MPGLTAPQIEFVFDFVERLCGIALDQTRSYLIDTRLEPLVKQYGLTSVVELVEKAKLPNNDPLRRAIIEAITTRETSFFRDGSPFEALQFKALPELMDVKFKAKSNRIRIWSAAASTGQEACSIAITLMEMVPDFHRWDIQILGTDISEVALAKARSGIYSQLEIERGLSQRMIDKYFARHPDGYQATDSVMRLIQYQPMNLLEPFRFPNPFDIVFCRNVAIYFDKQVKINLFRRLLDVMPAHGYLFVGASESLFDCGPEFRPLAHCRTTFYQPNLTQRSPSVR